VICTRPQCYHFPRLPSSLGGGQGQTRRRSLVPSAITITTDSVPPARKTLGVEGSVARKASDSRRGRVVSKFAGVFGSQALCAAAHQHGHGRSSRPCVRRCNHDGRTPQLAGGHAHRLTGIVTFHNRRYQARRRAQSAKAPKPISASDAGSGTLVMSRS
jgi:hypothetical protein